MSDEFRLLPDEAALVGRTAPLPSVRRVATQTPSGEVSALVWGDAPAVTLLHGAALNAHTWDATLLALGRDAIALDLPGHGDSAWRDDFDYSPAVNAEAAAAVIDAVAPGVPQAIVGHSLGGLSAIALAATRPDLVSALVIVDVSPGLRLGDAAQVSDFLTGPQVFPSREAIVESALAAGIGDDRATLARGVELNTRVRDDGSVIWKHHFGNPPQDGTFGSAGLRDLTLLWPGLTEADVPVLLVRGATGYLAPEVVEEFREKVPRAIVVELATGHNVQEQDPVGLAAAISGFLSGLA
ncbi:alpha/beta hydrolase [Gryllotalpicola sp.]|uniref:alpha/beta fold hydrolase n=1 Tax=Gryllotalpicola sp. TaxID=1932787 RepID=UPI0026046C43|nr:alpha/beta hydrolase [Gryllotalpicola sp.]